MPTQYNHRQMLVKGYVHRVEIVCPSEVISALTAKAYHSYLRKWISPRWGKYLVADLARPQLRSAMEAWLADLAETGKLAPKTVHSIGSLMRLIFRRAVKWSYLENNPMDFVDLPQGSTRRQEKTRTLTPAEYLKLLELFGPSGTACHRNCGMVGHAAQRRIRFEMAGSRPGQLCRHFPPGASFRVVYRNSRRMLRGPK